MWFLITTVSFFTKQISVLVELLAYIHEELSSNLTRTPAILTEEFCGFHQCLKANLVIHFNYAMITPSKCFPIHQSSYHSMVYSLGTYSVVKQITKKLYTISFTSYNSTLCTFISSLSFC
jgi:hypothetical protein